VPDPDAALQVLCAHRRLLYSWVPGIDTAAQDLGLFHFATAPSSEPGAPAGGLAFDVKGEEARPRSPATHPRSPPARRPRAG